MGRRPREDEPGSWHHVVNRGIAKRPLFETRDDIRFFLSRIAREVRAGRIEVHAFCILTTHFHFLVRSPACEMSEAFRRAQNAHSRRFNRRRKRDGSLVRGRFFSKRVWDDLYRRTLVRYIDRNPVQAGVVRRAAGYEFCSASMYALLSGPPWLVRGWVEAEARRLAEHAADPREAYAAAFSSLGDAGFELVERRLSSRARADPLTDLIGTTPDAVRRWMERKARLADGHQPGLPICTLAALSRALDNDEARRGPWAVRIQDLMKPGRDLAMVGLGRDMAGHTLAELSERIGKSVMQLRRLEALHRFGVARDAAYLERTSEVAGAALRDVFDA